jgi:HAD superfamily hydrolase (TIGR01509 family)
VGSGDATHSEREKALMVITIKSLKKEIKAVIFDMDGVLVDSIPAHKDSFNVALYRVGLPQMEEDLYLKVVGKNTRVIIDSYNDYYDLNLTEKQIEDILQIKGSIFSKNIKHIGRTTPGVIDWLSFLRKNHILCSVASSSTMENITFVLGALKIADYFSSIISGTYLPAGKPDPQIFLSAAASLGLPPNYCLVIEDAPLGIQAAKSAGMICCAIATTYPKSLLKEADLIYDSLALIAPNVLLEIN